jgi:hydrogenase/urease accessory protein HupE
MKSFAWLRACLLGVLLLAALPALAHKVGISRGVYRAEGSSLNAELTFARPEIASVVSGLDANGDGRLSDHEVELARDVLATTVIAGIEVNSNTGRCRGELVQAALTANDGLQLRLRYLCADAPESFKLRMSLLSSLSVGHRHLAAVAAGNSTVTRVLYEASPAFVVTAQPANATSDVAGPLFTLGIEHILTGFDHLLFLFGVVLVGGKLRTLLLAVTAFTLAHSVTLGLAALGVWAPSPSVVEPAIALSIVYVGVENWFVADASRRWLLTFPFGLVHGFGFAGALREIALPKADVPLALLSFNLGVEAGQVLVLAVVLPVLFWLRRRDWFARHGVRVGSTLVALTGLFWFVQRVGVALPI